MIAPGLRHSGGIRDGRKQPAQVPLTFMSLCYRAESLPVIIDRCSLSLGQLFSVLSVQFGVEL